MHTNKHSTLYISVDNASKYTQLSIYLCSQCNINIILLMIFRVRFKNSSLAENGNIDSRLKSSKTVLPIYTCNTLCIMLHYNNTSTDNNQHYFIHSHLHSRRLQMAMHSKLSQDTARSKVQAAITLNIKLTCQWKIILSSAKVQSFSTVWHSLPKLCVPLWLWDVFKVFLPHPIDLSTCS